MTINDVIFIDTETTGIPDRTAKWDVDYMNYPHVVQIAWMNQFKQESHIIYPDGWEIPQETIDVHGITTEYASDRLVRASEPSFSANTHVTAATA